MKKALSLLLALVLCLSLCACQTSNQDPTTPPTEPIVPPEPEDFSDVTVSIVQSYVSDEEVEDGKWLYKQIEEKFGCKVEVIEVYWSEGGYSEKMKELMEEGNLPTIFDNFLPMEQLMEYGKQGKFVDLMAPENLDRMPNFSKLLADDQQFHDAYTQTAAPDGSHYLLPTYLLPNDYSVFGWFYNEVAFEKAGVQWCGDPEGFLDMLRQLKAYYPDSYPMTGHTNSIHGVLNRVCNTYGVNSSYAAYNWDLNQWYWGATTDEYYDMLCLFQTAYQEKLLEPGMFYSHSGSMDDDIVWNRSFLFNSWVGWMTMYNRVFKEATDVPEIEGHLVTATTPVGPNGLTPEIVKFRDLNGTVINNQDPKAARCAMAIMDWMYDTSEDGGAWLNTVGPEEMLYVDESGEHNWNDVPLPSRVPNLQEYVRKTYGMFQPALTVRYCKESPALSPEEQMTEELLDTMAYLKAPPELLISDAAIKNAYQASQKEIKDMNAKFIIENWTREQFDDWCETFNAKYGHIIEYFNANS